MKYYLLFIIILAFTFGEEWRGALSDTSDRKNAEMIKKWKLIEFLDISEDQSEKFFTRVNAFEKEMSSIRKKEKELRELIEGFLTEDRLNEKEVSSLMGEYFNLEKDKLDVRQKHHNAIDDILTLEQSAKYLFFNHHFKKRVKEHFKDRKRGSRRKRF